jgi:hypothetical protein
MSLLLIRICGHHPVCGRNRRLASVRRASTRAEESDGTKPALAGDGAWGGRPRLRLLDGGARRLYRNSAHASNGANLTFAR